VSDRPLHISDVRWFIPHDDETRQEQRRIEQEKQWRRKHPVRLKRNERIR